MNRIWLVARYEFVRNVRRGSFLFAAFGSPLLLMAVIGIVTFFVNNSERDLSELGTIGFVDATNTLTTIADYPAYQPFSSAESAQAALEAQQIGLYLVFAEDYLGNGRVNAYANQSLPTELQAQVDAFIRANLHQQLQNPKVSAEIAQDVIDIRLTLLDSGRTLSTAAIIGLLFTPMVFLLVFMMAIQLSSGFLLSGVVQEKTNRLMEVLVTSVTPFQLLTGKIIGLSGLGLLQLVVWIAFGNLTLLLGQNVDFLQGVTLPIDMIAYGLLYFVLTYLMFSAILGGVGAAVDAEEESRQFAGILSLVLFVPFYFFGAFLTDGNGTAPTVLSMIPFTAAPSMLARLAFSAVPIWQIALSLGILAITTLLTMWAGARVFRWGMLMYGKKLTFGTLLQAIRRAPEAGVDIAVNNQKTVEAKS
jgi:ABC-2 type transport system permease protein